MNLFCKQVQHLINEFHINTLEQAQQNPAFLSRLYHLYLVSGDFNEHREAAMDDIDQGIREWILEQASVLANPEADRRLGEQFGDRLRARIWDNFESLWEREKRQALCVDEVEGCDKYFSRDRLTRPFAV